MNKEKLRKEVYETVWSIVNQQLRQHITINEDPEDDKLDDLEEQLEIGKYNGAFTWLLWRDGQSIMINAYDDGTAGIWLDEAVHRRITLNLIYSDNPGEFLEDLANTITDLIHIFLEGNWHILMDYLSPAAAGNTDWRQLLDCYKEYEIAHPYMCGNITYM